MNRNKLLAGVSHVPLAVPAPVLVTLDVEWERHPTNPLRNHVIAYGLRADVNGASKAIIVYPSGPEWRHRLTLGTLLAKILGQCIPDILGDMPSHVTLVTHYGRGDLAACKDFRLLKTKVDGLKGALTSAHGSVSLPVEIDGKSGLPIDALPRMPNRRDMMINDPVGGTKAITVTFRDTSLLAPEGSKRSLDSIGDLLGLSKLDLPEGYSKARMGEFFESDRENAELYLRRDLEVTARYFLRVQALVWGMGLKAVPPTIGAIAVSRMNAVLRDMSDPDDRDQMHRKLFGTSNRQRRVYSPTRGTYRTVTTLAVDLARRVVEPMMAEGYHGGRTETFVTGPTPPGILLCDIDAKGAYPTAMTAIKMPDYDRARLSTDLEDFKADCLGVAELTFINPPHLRFPVFPVRTDHGLVFPVQGTTVATSQEIAAARRLGVTIIIHRGFIIPWAEDVRPYEVFVCEMLALRNRLKSESGADTVESLLVKTIANSLYGKTAQAVRPRNVFDSRTGGDKALSPSGVTNAAFAAFVTGMVRGAIAEMLNGIPPDRMVVSVSTDGFLTSATIDEIDVSGPCCEVLAECRHRLTGDSSILEVKKRVRQVIAARNRAAFTTMPVDGSKTVTAKGSVKVPAGADADEWLTELYLSRAGDTTIEREDLISLRDQWNKNSDLVAVRRTSRLNMEPDYKRNLVCPKMERIGNGPYAGREHLSTSSAPFVTVSEMLTTRTLFEGWRHATGRCLKTLEDWADWVDYRDSTLAAREAGRRPHRTAGGSADDLKRQFLRALVREEWGLALAGRSYADVAEWLTAAGYRTTLSSVKNAARPEAKLVPHSIAATEGTTALLKVIRQEFPDFIYRHAFVAGQLDRVNDLVPRRRLADILASAK